MLYNYERLKVGERDGRGRRGRNLPMVAFKFFFYHRQAKLTNYSLESVRGPPACLCVFPFQFLFQIMADEELGRRKKKEEKKGEGWVGVGWGWGAGLH